MVLSEAVVEAARAGNVATVEQWLNAGGDANERCAMMGKTLLHYLASDSLLSEGEEVFFSAPPSVEAAGSRSIRKLNY